MHISDDKTFIFGNVTRKRLANSFMGSPKNYTLFRNVIDLVKYNVKHKLYGMFITDIASPMTFRKAYDMCDNNHKKNLHILSDFNEPWTSFTSKQDEEIINLYHNTEYR